MIERVFSVTNEHANTLDHRFYIFRSIPRRQTPKPAVLMRHAHIQTTMQYYVDLDVDDIADEVWEWGR